MLEILEVRCFLDDEGDGDTEGHGSMPTIQNTARHPMLAAMCSEKKADDPNPIAHPTGTVPVIHPRCFAGTDSAMRTVASPHET